MLQQCQICIGCMEGQALGDAWRVETCLGAVDYIEGIQ